MGTFIDPKAREKFEIDEHNTVYLRRRMDIRTEAAVERELMEMRIGDAAALSEGDTSGMSFHVGLSAQRLALLKHNIVAWEGPRFEQNGRLARCTPAMIGLLDPVENDDWIERVAERIGELNRKAADTTPDGDPKVTAESLG